MKANGGYVVENFRVPEVAPKPVLEASKRFEELSAELQAVTREWDGAIKTRGEDIADANRAAAAARVNKTKPPEPTVAQVEANLARLRSEREVLLGAVDLAGNALAEVCGEHQSEWLEMLDAIDADATERLRVALAAARSAVEDLSVVRAAPEWVRSFSAQAALGGNQVPYHGGAARGRTELDVLDELVDGRTVLVGYTDGQPIWKQERVS